MNSKCDNGIWVFAEQRDGVIHETVFELLAKAQDLKTHCQESVTAVLLGSSVHALADTLIARGADQVIVAEDAALGTYSARPYQQALTQLVKEYRPSILLYGATSIGRDLAPRMMISLRTGLTADAIDLGFDEEGEFYQTAVMPVPTERVCSSAAAAASRRRPRSSRCRSLRGYLAVRSAVRVRSSRAVCCRTACRSVSPV